MSVMDDVLAAKYDFEEFATNDKFIDQGYYDSEDGVVVKDYHMEWVNALEDNQKVAITAFTGSGKTSIPGVLYPLWRIFRDPSTNILIISATLSQATRILNEIKHHIEHADYLEELKPEDRQASWSKSKVEFTTGGEIKCKPIGNGAKAVKGSHVDLAICTPGYTRVETPEGSKKIENIEEGDLVKTHRGRFKPVLEKMVRKTTGAGYEIDAGGLHVRLTPEHPVRLGDEWVSAENVEEGDVLQYPVDEGDSKKFELRENGKKDLDIKLDKKFARLLGWYMAEGSLSKRGVRITNADSTDLEEIQSLMDDKLGGYSVDDHLSWSSNVLFSSVDLRDSFEEWFNSCATEKKVPEFIFESSEVVKASFLEAWIRGDGTDVYNDEGDLKETTIYTSSEQAVEDAKRLIQSIGGEVTVSKHSNEDSTFGGGDRYHVFMHSRTARKVKALATNDVENGKMLLPVTNVKKTRVSYWSRDNKVYNLKVKDDNSYVANGIATHNCDEAAEFDDQEKFHRNVRTRVESQSGDICLISTPVHENDLMANVSDGEMEPKCKLCRRTLDDGVECPEHGELEDREIDGGENISEMGFWNKSYGVYEEDVSPDDKDSFPLTTSDETKHVRPLFPENFDRQKIMKLREENMTMFQKEYLCLGKGTKIQLDEGMKNIEDVELGDKVLTHEGNFKEVTETMERKAKEKVKVKTKGWSEKIEMTPEHPVLTEEGWKDASELQPKDYLVTPRMSGEESISKEIGKIFGFYLAEGSIGASDRQVTFNFGAHEEDLIEECKQALRSEGYEPKLYGYGDASVCRVTVNSVDLVDELISKFGRAKDKKVPSSIFELDKPSIESVFEAYVDGDGYTPNEGRGKISSVSLELAEGAARMATSLGYTVTRDYFKQQGDGGVIDGRKIEGNGKYHRVRYYKNTQYNKIEDDYIAYRVKSVEFEKEESKVYNIEVEDDHTYHTAQFAVHNCEPLAVEGDLFDPNDIIELYDKDESFEQRRREGCDYYMGADFAISHQGAGFQDEGA